MLHSQLYQPGCITNIKLCQQAFALCIYGNLSIVKQDYTKQTQVSRKEHLCILVNITV